MKETDIEGLRVRGRKVEIVELEIERWRERVIETYRGLPLPLFSHVSIVEVLEIQDLGYKYSFTYHTPNMCS